VREKYIADIANKRVVLVDDVMTTGATATACAKTLLKSGAGSVDVLTLARVIRPFPL
jgi:predicted amidophosphoribosyltransferase